MSRLKCCAPASVLLNIGSRENRLDVDAKKGADLYRVTGPPQVKLFRISGYIRMMVGFMVLFVRTAAAGSVLCKAEIHGFIC